MIFHKFVVFLFLFICISCSEKSNNIDQTINRLGGKLKANQCVTNININKDSFYKAESIFTGGGIINRTGLKISLKDQFSGNVIISIENENWYKTKPYKVSFKEGFPIGANSGSFLIGKISDIVNNKGEGYILYNGYFEVKYLSSKMFALTVKGQLKSPFGDEDLKSIDGIIIWKNPKLNMAEIDSTSVNIDFK